MASIEAVEIIVVEYAVSRENQDQQHQVTNLIIALENQLPVGDFTDDGMVDFSDFFLFADHFGGTDIRYDLVSDGVVDFSDFFLFADTFGSEGQVVGKIVIPAVNMDDVQDDVQEVVIVGSINTEGAETVEIVGTIAPEDTVHVEVIGTISE